MNGAASGGAGTAVASLLFKPAPWQIKAKEGQNSWEQDRVDDCQGFCLASVCLKAIVGACDCALLYAFGHARLKCSGSCMMSTHLNVPTHTTLKSG